MVRITNAQKILHYLELNSGLYCDSCLLKEYNISSRSTVYQECNYLKQMNRIERKIFECSKCGKRVYVNGLTEIANNSRDKVNVNSTSINTHEKTIIEFLKQKDLKYCDDCIAKLCNIEPRQTVNKVCRKAFQNGKIMREHSQCSYCRKNKIINSYNPKSEQSISIEEQ
jgi:ribosomal protein L37AE/L43A